MLYKLGIDQENLLLSRPETGMGYQIVEAIRHDRYSSEKFIILNSRIVIELDGFESKYFKKLLTEGIQPVTDSASVISLRAVGVLNKRQALATLNESGSEKEKGAIDNPVEYADGIEVFVRLSAFDDDKRIDKIKKCLFPGSFTTTTGDYLNCKKYNDDPVERYALLSEFEIKYAFHIKPEKLEPLQRGIVQPVNNKKGGGKEAYFEKGTKPGTFITQTPY